MFKQVGITDAQMTEVATWVEDGPDLAKDGVVPRMVLVATYV